METVARNHNKQDKKKGLWGRIRSIGSSKNLTASSSPSKELAPSLMLHAGLPRASFSGKSTSSSDISRPSSRLAALPPTPEDGFLVPFPTCAQSQPTCNLSASMPPSIAMALTRSYSSSRSTISFSNPNKSDDIRGTVNSSSLLELRLFADTLGVLDTLSVGSKEGDTAGSAYWEDMKKSTHGRSTALAASTRRPGLATIGLSPYLPQIRQDSSTGTQSSSSPATGSSTSLLSSDWPTTAHSDKTDFSSHRSNSNYTTASEAPIAKYREALADAKSPLMVNVPSCSGQSMLADFGTSLGVGTFGSMILMDSYEEGYLGGQTEPGLEDEFAQAIETRLREIMGIAE